MNKIIKALKQLNDFLSNYTNKISNEIGPKIYKGKVKEIYEKNESLSKYLPKLGNFVAKYPLAVIATLSLLLLVGDDNDYDFPEVELVKKITYDRTDFDKHTEYFLEGILFEDYDLDKTKKLKVPTEAQPIHASHGRDQILLAKTVEIISSNIEDVLSSSILIKHAISNVELKNGSSVDDYSSMLGNDFNIGYYNGIDQMLREIKIDPANLKVVLYSQIRHVQKVFRDLDEEIDKFKYFVAHPNFESLEEVENLYYITKYSEGQSYNSDDFKKALENNFGYLDTKIKAILDDNKIHDIEDSVTGTSYRRYVDNYKTERVDLTNANPIEKRSTLAKIDNTEIGDQYKLYKALDRDLGELEHLLKIFTDGTNLIKKPNPDGPNKSSEAENPTYITAPKTLYGLLEKTGIPLSCLDNFGKPISKETLLKLYYQAYSYNKSTGYSSAGYAASVIANTLICNREYLNLTFTNLVNELELLIQEEVSTIVDTVIDKSEEAQSEHIRRHNLVTSYPRLFESAEPNFIATSSNERESIKKKLIQSYKADLYLTLSKHNKLKLIYEFEKWLSEQSYANVMTLIADCENSLQEPVGDTEEDKDAVLEFIKNNVAQTPLKEEFEVAIANIYEVKNNFEPLINKISDLQKEDMVNASALKEQQRLENLKEDYNDFSQELCTAISNFINEIRTNSLVNTENQIFDRTLSAEEKIAKILQTDVQCTLSGEKITIISSNKFKAPYKINSFEPDIKGYLNWNSPSDKLFDQKTNIKRDRKGRFTSLYEAQIIDKDQEFAQYIISVKHVGIEDEALGTVSVRAILENEHLYISEASMSFEYQLNGRPTVQSKDIALELNTHFLEKSPNKSKVEEYLSNSFAKYIADHPNTKEIFKIPHLMMVDDFDSNCLSKPVINQLRVAISRAVAPNFKGSGVDELDFLNAALRLEGDGSQYGNGDLSAFVEMSPVSDKFKTYYNTEVFQRIFEDTSRYLDEFNNKLTYVAAAGPVVASHANELKEAYRAIYENFIKESISHPAGSFLKENGIITQGSLDTSTLVNVKVSEDGVISILKNDNSDIITEVLFNLLNGIQIEPLTYYGVSVGIENQINIEFGTPTSDYTTFLTISQ